MYTRALDVAQGSGLGVWGYQGGRCQMNDLRRHSVGCLGLQNSGSRI